MIKAFKYKETEKFFEGSFSDKLPLNIQWISERKLIVIQRAGEPNDLLVPPANRL